jgi:hypothetical protein
VLDIKLIRDNPDLVRHYPSRLRDCKIDPKEGAVLLPWPEQLHLAYSLQV